MSMNIDKNVQHVNPYSQEQLLVVEEVGLRVQTVVATANASQLSTSVNKSWKQLTRYGPSSDVPSSVIIALSLASGATAVWLMTGQVQNDRDHKYHWTYLSERVNWLLEKVRFYRDAEHDELVADFQQRANAAIEMATNWNPDLWPSKQAEQEPDNVDDDVAMVPRYDVKLSAGAGAWSDRARQIGSLAFQRSYLAKFGAADGKGLIVLGVGGDSMAPTLRDGATVLVQTDLTGWEDGVWAFAQDDVLRVKRLQRGLSKLTIISDNPQYAPEELPLEEADALQLIGKCKWAGQSL